MEQLLSQRRKSELENEVLKTIELAGVICTQRSQEDLVKNIKLLLPQFFGFEGANILLRDVKTNLIFTINELSKDESNLPSKLRSTGDSFFKSENEHTDESSS